MNNISTFLAVLVFGILGVFLGLFINSPEAVGNVFAIAMAAACIVSVIEKHHTS